MQGHFDTCLVPVGKYTDEDFERACKEGYIDEMVAEIGPAQVTSGENQVFHGFPAYCFQHLFSGASVGVAISRGAGGGAFLASIQMNSRSEVPVYNTNWGETYSSHNTFDNPVGSSAGKRFMEDMTTATHDSIVDPSGRQSIIFRNKFLYRTTEANGTIYTIMVMYSHDADNAGNTYKGRVCGIRLRDSNGNLTVINKTSNEVLLVEYTFTLTNI